MATTARQCKNHVNRNWTCIQHEIVDPKRKIRVTFFSAIGGVLYQAFVSGVFMTERLSSLFRSENVVGTLVFLAFIAITVYVAAIVVVDMKETSLVKYAAAAAATPFVIFNGVLEPIIRVTG